MNKKKSVGKVLENVVISILLSNEAINAEQHLLQHAAAKRRATACNMLRATGYGQHTLHLNLI